jgi:hypothetical protein
MRPSLLFIALAFSGFLLAEAAPAHAQAASSWKSFMGGEEKTPEPPQEAPPLPEGAIPLEEEDEYEPPAAEPVNGADYYQQERRQFPSLPPSRPCTMQDVQGMWRLLDVFEDPPGQEMGNFAVNRYQYMLFDKDNVFGKYSSPTISLPAVMLKPEIEKQARQQGLQQYLLNESGVLYFYSQGIATDSMACFIVANERGVFTVGQMLLMPPKGQIKGRLVKSYIRYGAKKKPKRR